MSDWKQRLTTTLASEGKQRAENQRREATSAAKEEQNARTVGWYFSQVVPRATNAVEQFMRGYGRDVRPDFRNDSPGEYICTIPFDDRVVVIVTGRFGPHGLSGVVESYKNSMLQESRTIHLRDDNSTGSRMTDEDALHDIVMELYANIVAP